MVPGLLAVTATAIVMLALAAALGGWGTSKPVSATAGPGRAAAPSDPPTTSTAPDATTTDAPAAPAPNLEPPPPGSADSVTLAFAGDVHFEDQLAARLDDPATALAPIAPALAAADLTVVNLESSITTRGTPEPKKYHFRTSPAALDALAAAGVDIVTMANNHAVDYGAVGLADTLDAVAESPVAVVGIGRDADAAFAPVVRQVEGVTVAVLGATQVNDRTAAAWAAAPDRPGVAVARIPTQLIASVRAAAQQAQVVVVYLHYGTEQVGCPTSEQRTLVRQLVDAGADAVVGSHTHVQLGAGWSGPAYVSYGLGNLVWYGRGSAAEARTGVLTLTVRDGRVVQDAWLPATVGADGLPHPDADDDAPAAVAQWRSLARCAGLSVEAPDPTA